MDRYEVGPKHCTSDVSGTGNEKMVVAIFGPLTLEVIFLPRSVVSLATQDYIFGNAAYCRYILSAFAACNVRT